ncbi:MAG TPA: hypothetical protein VHN99_02980, partial [Deinococcales bacterium]|nr:hypothetical protein [Deinococcales bacterium]
AGNPLSTRVIRRTRETLRGYAGLGYPALNPARRLTEIRRFERPDVEEVALAGVLDYLTGLKAAAEQDREGSTAAVTALHRRLSGPLAALLESLEGRLDTARRAEAARAAPPLYLPLEAAGPADLDEMTGEAPAAGWPAGWPRTPDQAGVDARRLGEVLPALREAAGSDSRLAALRAALLERLPFGPVVVFTASRAGLGAAAGAAIGLDETGVGVVTFDAPEAEDTAGTGGRQWLYDAWRPLDRVDASEALREGAIRVIVVHDDAPRTLELTGAASAVHLDLPPNLWRLEERASRLDRPGQEREAVHVTLLVPEGSREDDVLRALEGDLNLLDRPDPALKPVLTLAQAMLDGRESLSTRALRDTLDRLSADPAFTVLQPAERAPEAALPAAPVTQADLLAFLDGLVNVGADYGVNLSTGLDGLYTLSWAATPVRLRADPAGLARDPGAQPVTLPGKVFGYLATALNRPGEVQPLVVETAREAGFARSVAAWVTRGGSRPVETLQQLQALLRDWTGEAPRPDDVAVARAAARAEAAAAVAGLRRAARDAADSALARQAQAARVRLLREVGRYIVAAGRGVDDLNGEWTRLAAQRSPAAARLRDARQRFGVPPQWPEAWLQEFQTWNSALTPKARQDRLAGKEL